jgi:hypothetical protein
MHSLRKLVHQKLIAVGTKAQDQIDSEDSFSEVNAELTKAWDFCGQDDLDAAAEIAIRMDVVTDRILRQEKLDAARQTG